MKSFPPSPQNVPAATRFVKDLPRRKGASDYEAVREAGMMPVGGGIMFIAIAGIQADKIQALSLAICLVSFLTGILFLVLSFRTLALLDLFPNQDLPEIHPDSLGRDEILIPEDKPQS